MRVPSAYATPQRMKPINVSPNSRGEMVPYRQNPLPSPLPTKLNPEPYGARNSTQPFRIPALSKPGDAEGELRKTVDPRRPVVDSDGRSSSQSRQPENYPQYPNPADGWKTTADWDAWRNGKSRSSIDAEREAYDFTKEWGKAGGILYPFTDQGPRTPIISDNFEKANRYRARNGLPSIDRFGYEQALPVNPSNPPLGDFASNPFKLDRPAIDRIFGTPSNFDASPYSDDIDPDTGEPYTGLQKTRGDELGRPPWHINPETGNPWGSDEPGSPLPLPFDGAPGGGLRYPSPKTTGPTIGIWTITIAPTINTNNRTLQVAGYVSDRPAVIEVAPVVPGFSVCYAGALQTEGGTLQLSQCYSHYPINVYGTFSASDSGTTDDDTPIDFTPIGRPAPILNPVAPVVPVPRPEPKPVQDPRVNPTKPAPLPFAPNKKPIDNPNTVPFLPRPQPSPLVRPTPEIPGQPNYAPSPRPYPRVDPNGKPQPNSNPQNQPEPARPTKPKPDSTVDRKPPPADRDEKCKPSTEKCPDPCKEEKVVQITYKKFVGCNKTVTGAPDRFRNDVMSVPEKLAEAMKASLNSIAEIEAQKCEPCCYWDVMKGSRANLFTGIPTVQGSEVLLPKGCVNIGIAYDIASAKADNTLRNLKRIASGNRNEGTFVNTMRVWIVDSKGNAIGDEELWVPSTVLSIPFSYRDEVCRLRMMPKSISIEFTVFDTGDRWMQKID